jgi:hypothetical protein
MLATMVAVRLRAACVNRSWRRYPIPNRARRRLRLRLGLSNSLEARLFVQAVLELVASLESARPGLKLASDAKRFGDMLAGAMADALADDLRPARCCWSLLGIPCHCCCLKWFEIEPSSITAKQSRISEAFFERLDRRSEHALARSARTLSPS